MTPPGTTSTLQRKMAAGLEDTHGSERSALRALRLGLARAARDVFHLPLLVIGATQARATQDALGKHFDDDCLLVLLDGPDRAIGVLSFDRSCLAALIQQQTMGQITAGEPDARPFTATDAALVAPLVDAMLARAADLTELVADKACLTGYRFGARCENLRSLMLIAEADRFRIFNLTVDLGGGLRQGAFCLALPDVKPSTAAVSDASDHGAARMQRVVGAARAEFSVVIGRMRITLAELSDMRPGDVMPLDQNRLDQAEVVSIDGGKVARGRLGQVGGFKAVRVNESADPLTYRGSDSQTFQPSTSPGSVAEPDRGLAGQMPTLPEAWSDGEADEPGEGAMGGLPAFAMNTFEDADTLPEMSPEDTAMEISSLAGLSMDESDESPPWPSPEQET